IESRDKSQAGNPAHRQGLRVGDFTCDNRGLAIRQRNAAFIFAVSNHRNSIERLSGKYAQVELQLQTYVVAGADGWLCFDRKPKIFVVERGERSLEAIVLKYLRNCGSIEDWRKRGVQYRITAPDSKR